MTQQEIDEWNRRYPPGSRCLLKYEDGCYHDHRTMSFAWILGSGDAVVRISERPGCQVLESITMLDHPANSDGGSGIAADTKQQPMDAMQASDAFKLQRDYDRLKENYALLRMALKHLINSTLPDPQEDAEMFYAWAAAKALLETMPEDGV